MTHRAGPGSDRRGKGEGLADTVFARLVVMRGLATQRDVDTCLRIQEEAAAGGTRASIDSILIERGVLSPAEVSRLLEYQAERIRVCPECDALVETDGGGGVQCPACRAVISGGEVAVGAGTRTSVTAASGITVRREEDGLPEAETIVRDPWDGAETSDRIPVAKGERGDETTTRAPSGTDAGPKVLQAIPLPPDDPANLIGKVIGGCEISALLGRGGMGAVYRARRLSLKKTVALKLLPQTFTRSQDAVKRFSREARSAGQLRHPNIVEVFNIGEDQGFHYIEMEYVDGSALREVLEETGRLPTDRLIQVMESAARALEAAHREGVIHRDIKPDNIMLTAGGELKITDFGLARGTEDSLEVTREGQVLGTPHYMSPEQCEGKVLDRRSDIYSLGVTFYHMATGKRPFSGDSAVVILRKHIQEVAPSPREVAPDLPDGVSAIIEKMMEKEVGERYQGMADVILDIERMKLGRSVAGRPAAAAAPAGRRVGWTFPIGAILTLGLAAGVFAHSWISSPSNDPMEGRETIVGEVGVGEAEAEGGVIDPLPVEEAPGVPTPAAEGESAEEEAPSPEESGSVGAEPADMAAPPAEPAIPPPSPLGLEIRAWWRERARSIPAGEYRVGTTDVEFENDPRTIRLAAFEISEYEITNAEYEIFVDAGGYEREDLWGDEGWRKVETYTCRGGERRGPAFWPDGRPPEGEGAYPVVGVSFEEASAYCAWLATMHPELEGIRLPTEDEWEVAASWDKARGEKLDYPWGNEWGTRRANIGSGGAARVGSSSYDRSTFGCQDMAGNVREWVTGCLPGCEGAPVQRGACFENELKPESFARCESRLAPADPAFRHRRWDYTGFRVVLPRGTAGGPGQ